MGKIILTPGYLLLFLLISCGFPGNSQTSLGDHIKQNSRQLLHSGNLDPLVDAAANARLVLLGEASHGTHEYYIWRDSISRRLIAEKGFNFIAVEGDFASLYELNRYVKDLPGAASSAREVLRNLDRWPTWMWGNKEVEGLAEWLRELNKGLSPGKKVGFYGMDVYDEWKSKEALLDFLRENNPAVYNQVAEYYSCFTPYIGDSWAYAQAVQRGQPDCAGQTSQVVQILTESREMFNDISDYDYFYVLQNAIVKKNAEKFYRKSMTRRDQSSWNSRANHMHETVNRLLALYGEGSKGIVWAHNTHIGDARFTEMYHHGQQNIGELSRVQWGPENIFSVGFTTYRGRVKAAMQWGDRMREMPIAPAQRNSAEHLMQQTGNTSFYLIFDDNDRTHPEFIKPMGHRAVGVVFNPANEPRQYVNTILPLRYDAFIFFKETRALNPIR
jgi:erythromycin esterase